nr:MAG TPA: hypothetical protein [Caudoviricetes sp.]
MTNEEIIQEVIAKLELEIESTVKRIDLLCDKAEDTGYAVLRENNVVTISGRKPWQNFLLQGEFDELRGRINGLRIAIMYLKRSEY